MGVDLPVFHSIALRVALAENANVRQPGKSSSVSPAEPGRRTGRGTASLRKHLKTDEKRKVVALEPLSLPRGQYTILVVDDVAAARYATARMLRAAGFKTREAASGAEALAQAGCVCAVVLDVHLPDIHGLEVCRLLRSNAATRRLPVVHVSAIYVSDDDRASGHSAGADAYLLAPVSQQELTGTLDKLLESRHGCECGALCFPRLP